MRTASGKMFLVLVLLTGVGGMANGQFAAIAYSPQTGNWGYSNGYQNLAAAQNNALDRCNTADARLAVWVENGWAALAKAENGTYGWAWSGNSRAEAESQAKQNAGAGATIVCWTYSGT